MGASEVEKRAKEKVFVKVARACGPDGLNERWAACDVCPTLNVFDNTGDIRAVVLITENIRKRK